VIGLVVVGARRLEQLRYLAHDPLVARLCGLARIPTDRTVVNWLKQFTQEALQALITLNSALLYEQLERLNLPRLTIDVDGTVVRTGNTVAWAFRGYNPHFKKDPSYYPLLAHLAQTGHIPRLKNRPGNVHDSRGAVRFLRELIHELRDRFGRSLPLEFRMDAAFFQEEILTLLAREGCEYAIKVGFWKWVGLKALVAAQRDWTGSTPRSAPSKPRSGLSPGI
jgi:Transposase DDE domain group 1